MADIATLNGNVLLQTDPTSPATALGILRTDAGMPNNPLAQISMLGAGTGNLQGAIVMRTMNTGTANGPLEERMRVHVNGNVGIGTPAPVNKLDVNGDIALQGKHALRGSDPWLRLNQDGAFTSGVHTPGNFAPNALNVGGAGGWGNPGAGNAWITGSVGIGTTAPQRKLHVHDDAISEIHSSGAGAGFSYTDREAGRQWDNGAAGQRWVLYSAGRNTRLWTSGIGDLLTVTSEGDLHMRGGRTLYSPGRMHIHGEEILYLLNKNGVVIGKEWGGSGDLTVQGNATVTGHWAIVHGAGSEQAYLGGDGSGGDVQVGSFNAAATTVSFWNGSTGTWMNARAKAFLTSSDVRLKTNIEPLRGALERVLKLKAVKFDWAGEAGKREGRRVGFIAQEVMAVVPEAVSQDAKGMYYISEGTLVSMLVEAIKEQNARIERLEADLRVAAGPASKPLAEFGASDA